MDKNIIFLLNYIKKSRLINSVLKWVYYLGTRLLFLDRLKLELLTWKI